MVSTSEIDKVTANIDLPGENRAKNEGRLTGRTQSCKENKLSKSLAETSINRFKEKENDPDTDKNISYTPATTQEKLKDGLPSPKAEAVMIDDDSIERE